MTSSEIAAATRSDMSPLSAGPDLPGSNGAPAVAAEAPSRMRPIRRPPCARSPRPTRPIRRPPGSAAVTDQIEPLAVLLLPRRLEDFELAAHAQDLLAIPRVVAVEPPRRRGSRPAREMVAAMQARRLQFPGEPRVVVLYDPEQYPLARALLGVHAHAELWYARPAPAEPADGPWRDGEQRRELDYLARARAEHLTVATAHGDPRAENQPLRDRLVELGVISHQPFVPGVHIGPAPASADGHIPRMGWGRRTGPGRGQFG